MSAKNFQRLPWRRTSRGWSADVFPAIISVLAVLQFAMTAGAAGRQVMHGEVPAVTAHLQPMGQPSGTNHLSLAIGLPLRNQAALNNLLQEIYDPASTNYHHYLTPEQFAERFGPTEQDYQAVIAFAKANGLTIKGTHPNRMLVDVDGPVATFEKALQVTLRTYQHPFESRKFYAPDVEPSLDLGVPVLHISGLDNYIVPRPMDLKIAPLNMTAEAIPNAGTGTGPAGTFMGYDFRAAYAPGVSLTGAGQTLGLLEFDGYYANDIAAYVSQAGLPGVTLTNVLIDGYSGTPGLNNGAVALDIEMAISMAPGLSRVIVYESTNNAGSSVTDDLLNRMATDNLAKQISSSWSYPIDSITEQIFQQFALQGQSFFNASGDSDAWVGAINPPSADTNITIVGGTTLTMSGSGGSWTSETVWNKGNGIGSGGGISTNYTIPGWQQGVDMSANQGSATMRNIPDVAMVADNVFVIYGNGNAGIFSGTGCSTPLWAAFTALVNQQAVADGHPTVGFISPAIYAIGLGSSYTSAFHDITTGNNTSSSSPAKFYAVAGYDLCTGWGTPAGQTLINALVGLAAPTPPTIAIQPRNQTNALGNTASFSVTAIGSFPLSYQWSFNGTNNIIIGATKATLLVTNVQLTNAGNYAVLVTNAYGSILSSNATLTVLSPPPTITIQPGNQTALVGGTAIFSVTAAGSMPLSYQWRFGATNIIGATNPALVLANVQYTNAGNYTVLVTNVYGSTLSSNAVLTVNTAPPCATAPSGLASWWAAEGNGNDSAGTNTAILQAVAFGAGEVGQAFSFNGVSAYARVPASSNLNAGQGTGLTIEAWINPASPGDIRPVFEWNNNSGQLSGTGVQLWLSVNGAGELHANVLDTAGNNHNLGSANGVMTANNFQHIALTYDKTTGVAVLYRNGVAMATQTMGSFTPQTSFDLYMGVRPSGSFSGLYFQGMLDEVSLYNRALTAAEIQSIYNAGAGGKCSLTPTPPSIIVQPTNQTVMAGSAVTFTVMAGGTAPLSYQWALGLTNIAGATNTVLTLTNVQLTNAGSYTVLVTNAYGSILSSNAVLTVYVPPFIVTQPTNQTVVVGNTATFTVVAGGTAPLSYQWAFGVTNITGATNAVLILTNVQPAQAGNYTVLVTNAHGSILSSNAVLTVSIPPFITTQPTNQTVAVGGTATFTVVAGGTPPLNYQWNFNGTNIVRATNTVLTLTNVQLNQAGNYAVLVTNASGSVLSSNAVLAVYTIPPFIVTQPTNQTVAVGSTATFTVVAGGTAPLRYQWAFGVTNISGATNTVLTLTNVQLTQAGNYTVLVTNAYGSILSSNAVLTVYTVPPFIVTQPTNQTVAVGNTATFTVVAGGTAPLRYQWAFGVTNIAGATNTVLTLTNVQLTQAGNYTVLVTNAYGSILSSNALLVVVIAHHFVWDPVPSPRFVNAPFSVVIQARNAANGVITNFNGFVNLSSTNGVAVNPLASGNFIQGVWTGSVTVQQVASNLVLRADDGLGHFGLANPISVINLPGLGLMHFGNVLLMQWPAVSPALVLETSANLSPAVWVTVPYVPAQIGDLYVVPLEMTGTNGFYRLRFIGP
jgi:hypothetical protein